VTATPARATGPSQAQATGPGQAQATGHITPQTASRTTSRAAAYGTPGDASPAAADRSAAHHIAPTTSRPTGPGAGHPSRLAWLAVAAALLGTGWGAQQFTPMLLLYSRTLGLGTGTLEALFGVYALGLIPGLLVGGPMSDAWGRRRVVVPAAVLSLAASVLLAAAGHLVVLLFAGRLVAGVSSGAAFGAGTAWLREISRPPWGTSSDPAAARRAAVAMTAGFALGPLVSGLLAQWAPAPAVTAYLPHLALMLVVLVLLRGAPETHLAGTRRPLRLTPPGLRHHRLRTVIAPMAPWVFAAPAIAFALLPSVVGAAHVTDGIALGAAITALTALCGVLIQPLARHLDASARGNRAATVGMVVLAAGLVLGAVTAASGQVWLLIPTGAVLGSAYGLCLVAGLVEIQRIAGPHELAGLTAAYYLLAYLGFAVPSLLVLAAHLASYAILLALVAVLALATAGYLARRPAAEPPRA
jgi:predicted MFS family arabinose efflux permease